MVETRPRILVVEDDPRILQAVAFLLARENYEIKLSGNGEEALQIVPEFRPDLVILDVMMPGMDGFEVCQRLRELSDDAPIPVVFLTARKGADNWERARDLDAVAYIEKPFKNAALIALVKQILVAEGSGE